MFILFYIKMDSLQINIAALCFHNNNLLYKDYSFNKIPVHLEESSERTRTGEQIFYGRHPLFTTLSLIYGKHNTYIIIYQDVEFEISQLTTDFLFKIIITDLVYKSSCES